MLPLARDMATTSGVVSLEKRECRNDRQSAGMIDLVLQGLDYNYNTLCRAHGDICWIDCGCVRHCYITQYTYIT